MDDKNYEMDLMAQSLTLGVIFLVCNIIGMVLFGV